MFPSNNLTACPNQKVWDGCYEADLDVQTFTSYGVGADVGFLPGGPQGATKTSMYDNFVSYREAFIENDIMPDVLSLSYEDQSWSLTEELENIL